MKSFVELSLPATVLQDYSFGQVKLPFLVVFHIALDCVDVGNHLQLELNPAQPQVGVQTN